jgi:hypothetical protein
MAVVGACLSVDWPPTVESGFTLAGGKSTSPDAGTVEAGGDASVGIDGGQLLVGLTPAQLNAVCNNTVAPYGGYDKMVPVTCPDSTNMTLTTIASLAVCLSYFPGLPQTCPATVSDFYNCYGSAGVCDHATACMTYSMCLTEP